jgi:beta-phosphoglucomutase-like phosphatase (HAD superfamily)
MSMTRMAESVANQIPFKAFDVIVAGDMVTHGKPHPEPYLMAARLLGVAPEDCVAFEDSLTGLTSAEAAGTKAVGVTNIVPIPAKPGRIIWPTLDGVTLRDLRKLF